MGGRLLTVPSYSEKLKVSFVKGTNAVHGGSTVMI